MAKKSKYNPRPGAYTTTLSPSDRKNLFLVLLEASGGNITEACRATGVSRNGYYHWVESDPDFKTAVKETHESLLDRAESKLIENIDRGDNTAIIFFLKCKGKSRGYVERPQPAPLAVPDSGVSLVTNLDLSKLTIKELKLLRELSIRMRATAEEDDEGSSALDME